MDKKKQGNEKIKKKKYLILNFFVPGIAHIFFKEYLYFLIVFGLTVFFIVLMIFNLIDLAKPFYDFFIDRNELPKLKWMLIGKIAVYMVILNIVHYFSLRKIIKNIEGTGK